MGKRQKGKLSFKKEIKEIEFKRVIVLYSDFNYLIVFI